MIKDWFTLDGEEYDVQLPGDRERLQQAQSY